MTTNRSESQALHAPLGRGTGARVDCAADTAALGGHDLVITGTALRRARLQEEWDADVTGPEGLIAALRGGSRRVDLFTFMQRLPDSRPRFPYAMEWDNVAAIPLTTFEHWLERQVHQNLRNKLRKSQKEGLVIRRVEFSDEFVAGIMKILNECPVRQGRPFSDYGKPFEVVKQEHSTYLDRSVFLGGYLDGELVGYLKLVDAGRFTRTMQVLSMIKHRNTATTNALMAEAVRLCCERGAPFLVYGKYNYGKKGSDTLKEFKAQNGFEPILLPRYYVPLTPLGAMALHTGWHNGLFGVLPRDVVKFMRAARARWYSNNSRQ
jgi:hypothetical protein